MTDKMPRILWVRLFLILAVFFYLVMWDSSVFLPHVLFWTFLEYSLMSCWTHFPHLFCLSCRRYLSFSVCICDCSMLLEMTTEHDLLFSAVLAKYAHFNHLTLQTSRAHANPQRSCFSDLVDAAPCVASAETQSCACVGRILCSCWDPSSDYVRS